MLVLVDMSVDSVCAGGCVLTVCVLVDLSVDCVLVDMSVDSVCAGGCVC